MKKVLKEFLTLLLLAWAATLLVQLLEFPFHKDFYLFTTLFLPLLLMASGVFLFLGIPILILSYGTASLIFKIFPKFKKWHISFALFLWLFSLFVFQTWIIQGANLWVGRYYYLFLSALLLILFLLSFFRWSRVTIALIAPLLLLGLSGWKFYQFWTPRCQGKAKGPNILLIVSDTTRQDHLSFYGYERDTTPYLKTLADQGMIFEDVISTSSWTKPAMASLLTSRYLVNDRIQIGPLPTSWHGMRLPEFFHRSGYDTSLITANPNTGSYFEATRGYSWIQEAYPPDHFALQTFVLPKLMRNLTRSKEWLQHRNNQNRLKEYQRALGFKSFTELSRFVRKILDSPNIPEEEKPIYRRHIRETLGNYAKSEIRIKKQYPEMQARWILPLADPIYRSILKFCFITLENARGKIENHWIRDQEISNLFFQWFEKKYDRQRPFFAHLQYMGPHSPYQEQPPYLIPHFDPQSPHNVENPPTQHTLPSHGAKKLPADKLHNMIANYDDAIRNTDANIQKVIEYLKEKNVLKNTLVVFVGDHGEAFYEHGIYGHMYSLYSEMVNVPLFFYWPEKIQSGRSNLPTSIVDIFPSLISLTGLQSFQDQAGPLEGKSVFQENGHLASENFQNRIRYGATRVSLRPKIDPKLTKKEKMKLKKTWNLSDDQKEGFHRMVIRGGQKLVEEIEGKDRRLFLFSLENPSEPLNPLQKDDPQITAMYQLFKPLPPAYEDFNEPRVQHELKE